VQLFQPHPQLDQLRNCWLIISKPTETSVNASSLGTPALHLHNSQKLFPQWLTAKGSLQHDSLSALPSSPSKNLNRRIIGTATGMEDILIIAQGSDVCQCGSSKRHWRQRVSQAIAAIAPNFLHHSLYLPKQKTII
jgi:hypothetical protein